MSLGNKKVWLVKFPTYQYNEDVVGLALAANLKIIDSNHGDSIDVDMVEKKPPKLTLKNQKAKPKKAKSKKIKVEEPEED